MNIIAMRLLKKADRNDAYTKYYNFLTNKLMDNIDVIAFDISEQVKEKDILNDSDIKDFIASYFENNISMNGTSYLLDLGIDYYPETFFKEKNISEEEQKFYDEKMLEKIDTDFYNDSKLQQKVFDEVKQLLSLQNI